MSRSGYSEDIDQWDLIRWRGQVASAMRGKRGQAFLREMVAALDAMPVKRLIAHDLQSPDGEVCAMGCVAIARGVPLDGLDPDEPEDVAQALGIANQLAQEIAYENDECGYGETPEQRWGRMRAWALAALRGEPPK